MATWMERWRGAGRLLRVAGVLATGGVAYACRPAHRRSPEAKARWLQGICRRLLQALAVRVSSEGVLPRGGLVAANHLGYLDVIVLASRTPLVFVAKREVATWPVFGWFARQAGTRFIDRRARADVKRTADELQLAHAQGLTVVVFLEGTSSDGRDVFPFRSSLLEPALASAWPVTPAALRYGVLAHRSAEQEVCYWGEMTLVPHLWNLASLPWIEARVRFGEPRCAEPGTDRKELARALRADVVALLRT